MGAPHPQTFAFTALLLAGGQSRRMGRDKAEIVFEGEPLWRRQWKTLLATRPRAAYIARGERSPDGMSELQCLPDEEPNCGPLGALVAGLRAAKTSWLIVLAVDLPSMPAAYLSQLLAQAAQTGRGVVPSGEPLAAVYPAAMLPLAEEALERRDLSLQALVRSGLRAGLLQERPIESEERPYFRNLNSPGDLPVSK